MLTVDHDHYAVLAALAAQATSYLEVGTYEGGSLQAVLQANPALSWAVCCDAWTKPRRDGQPAGPDPVRVLVDALSHPAAVQFVSGGSAVTLPRLPADLIADLTLVDGDHSEIACATDLALVWPHTRRWMVVHDVGRRDSVWRALSAFLRALPEGTAACELTLGDRHGAAIVTRLQEKQ